MDDWHETEQLHLAAADGDLERVKQLIEDGRDINAFDNTLSFTPLHYAVCAEHVDVAQYLLASGADVNAHDDAMIGETPLGAVAADCSYAIAELLVNAGANPTLPGWMQISALDRARERKRDEGRQVYELLHHAARKTFHHAK